ncbi:5-deoxy-glucuronate isomerase [Evansella caseinilytica]|uniref:5-deoxy-glucuronate isomerase n=1 Tax=Evansella caseinilytica TaxID=1503961 RepID=A0A1H3SVJ6_9BACI|nr:5-deoxy-glucuronate isomerase [Evansella caseinilytica]SDZ41737.1 5-deoxy-glucuronate isomerase [Evansella caseinilytica]
MSLRRKPLETKAQEPIQVVHDIHAGNAELKYIRFKVVDLAEGAVYKAETNNTEACVVILTGKADVTGGGETFTGIGKRKSVFDKEPTDSVYVSVDTALEIKAVSDATIALCCSPADRKKPTTLIAAEDVRMEHRGEGNNKRMVFNILPDDVSYAQHLLVVEVITESGNWSSYPPHKHDENRLPEESLLEETYYHEQEPPQGFVFQRVYTDDRSLDETMTVENRDVVLVPKGYHPVGVPEGYTSYYLNVMAGPERIWKFKNDPDHEWIINRNHREGGRADGNHIQ